MGTDRQAVRGRGGSPEPPWATEVNRRYHREATVQCFITFKALVIPFSAQLVTLSDCFEHRDSLG